MSGYLRQATASQSRSLGPFVSDTDFKTVQTGLTIANTDVKLIVNGGASSDKNSGGGTHRAGGVYGVTFDSTDTATVGQLTVVVVVAGAMVVWDTYTVLEESVYDAMFAASAPGYVVDQPVNATKLGGTSLTGRDIGASVLLSSGTGTGQVKLSSGYVAPNWGDVGNPTTTVGLSGTTVKTATDVETDTQDIQSRLPAALVSGRIDASVGAMAANVLTATAINSDAITAAKLASDVTTELQSGLATSSSVSTLQTSIDDLPTNAELATALGTADDAVLAQVALVKAVTDKLDDTLEDDAGTFRFTTHALEQAPSGGGSLTVQDIVDGVLDEMIASHQGAGSVGEAISDAGAAGNPWNAVIEGSYTAEDLLRVIAAYAVGKTTIVPTGANTATVTFRDVTDASNIIVGTADHSERTSVTLNP